MAKIFVKESEITVLSMNENDYISLTDIAKHKSDESFIVICNWMRNRIRLNTSESGKHCSIRILNLSNSIGLKKRQD